MRTYIEVTEKEAAAELENVAPGWLAEGEAVHRVVARKLRVLGPFARLADGRNERRFDGAFRISIDVPEDPRGLLLP